MVTKDDCFKRGSYRANSYTEASEKASKDEGWNDTEKDQLKLIAHHNFDPETQKRIRSAFNNKYLRFVIEELVYQFCKFDIGFAIMKFLHKPLAKFSDEQIKKELNHRSNNISFGKSHVCYFYIDKESNMNMLTDRKRFSDQDLISEMYERCRDNVT